MDENVYVAVGIRLAAEAAYRASAEGKANVAALWECGE